MRGMWFQGCALLAGLAFSSPAWADFELNILHFNDFHARFEPISKFGSTCTPEQSAKKECFGGIARLKAAVDAGRAAAGSTPVLVLDAGDDFQGSLFYTKYHGDPVAEFLNQIGVDAMTIGNHEFDNGPSVLADFVTKAKFPVLSGNMKAHSGTHIDDAIKGVTIKEFGAEKVAILGVTTVDTPEISSPGPDVQFVDEIAWLKDAVAGVRAKGITKVIVLSHVGYERDKQIAAAVPGISAIVGGHSHSYLSSTDPNAVGPYPTMVNGPDGKQVAIVTAFAYSRYLGNLKISFDAEGNLKSASGAAVSLDQSIPEDAAVAARVAELAKPLDELRNRVIGQSTGEIEGAHDVCRMRECAVGNLVTDALLDRVKGQGISIAIENGGGLRSSIAGGDVTMGSVLTVLPFQNTVATFNLKGSDLRLAIENGLSKFEENAGRFPQVAGMRYSFDPKKPAGQRVVSIEVADQTGFVPLDADKVYGVVANNYMRAGGDGYKVLAEKAANAYDFGPNLEDVVADFLAKNRPYQPHVDGRITLVKAP